MKEKKTFFGFRSAMISLVAIGAMLFSSASAASIEADKSKTHRTYSSVSKLFPLDLKAEWWSAYEQTPNEMLASKISVLKGEMEKIKNPQQAVLLRNEVALLLESYLQKRTTPLPMITHSFEHNRSYTVEDLYKIKKNIEVSTSKLALKESLLDELEQTIAKLEQENYKHQRAYLELKKDTAKKLLQGLHWMKSTLKLSIAKLNKTIDEKILDNMMQEYDLFVKDIIYATEHLHLSFQRIAKAKEKIATYQNALSREEKLLEKLQQNKAQTIESLDDALSSLQIMKQKGKIKTLQMLLGYEEVISYIGTLQEGGEKAAEFEKFYKAYNRLKKEHKAVSNWVEDTEERITEEKDLFEKQIAFLGENNQTNQALKVHEKILNETLRTGDELDESIERLDVALGALNHKLIKDASTFSLLKEKSKTTLYGLVVSLFLWMDDPLFEIDHTPVTAWDLLGFFITLLIGWYLAKFLSNSIMKLIPKRRADSLSSVNTIYNVIRTVVFGIMFLFALSNLGIDITKLTILISALSIGIGFGLQTIISNFVSGIILIFEKSIKLGDYIELADGTRGVVQEINIRSTIVNTYDNIDIVVPNSQFITGNVVNLTMKNKIIRIKVPFGVAYDSDIEEVKRVITQGASSLPYTLESEKFIPQVWLRVLGESALECELVVWIKPEYIDKIGSAKSSYAEMILKTLRAHQITIPFPQQEVRILR